ncbi:MAG TPA: uroporphyrinogen-III C-methyltransferase [Aquabacterium sp.]|uniref:uroporphyrinogen-III C-methyltransferase n=1 Tax=Aquabacterium sp. TaxID=1872578 RepID=UPI002E32CC74|nr:uroporphyrinogen-III C-methyltransferase [Aquabacterium sp.]HEX5355224.1 uroporphyrinogen-III C-methyltransferase [Aquabacterium sp.]
MTDTSAPTNLPTPIEVEPLPLDPQADSDVPGGWVRWAVVILSMATAGAGWVAWNTQKKVQALEQELVRRQIDSQGQATEARVLARQAQEAAREATARSTLLETRITEVALQRSQVEDLIKTLSLSRDENLVADIEAGLRVASQQATLTGSAEPLITAMQSADDRLARARQPRLDNIRRALAKDLDRVRATRVADTSSLTIRLDEAARLVDEVPLLNQPEATMPPLPKAEVTPKPVPASKPGGKNKNAAQSAAPASAPEPAADTWGSHVLDWTKGAAQTFWNETRGLIRLTRINRPEGMLISPDQGFFLRENIKLRLLNARLALLSRQNTVALADLQNIQATVPRYFDLQSRKTQLLQSMLTDVAAQSQQITVPRPDDTLAALATVSGGR